MIHLCLGDEFLKHNYGIVLVLGVQFPVVVPAQVGWFVLGFSPQVFMVVISVVIVVMVLTRLLFSVTRLSTWFMSILIVSTKVLIDAVNSLWYPSLDLLTSAFTKPLTWAIACLVWRLCYLDKCALKIGIPGFPWSCSSVWCRLLCTCMFGEWVTMLLYNLFFVVRATCCFCYFHAFLNLTKQHFVW